MSLFETIVNRPVSTVPAITIKAWNLIFEMAIGTFSYKVNNSLYTYYNASAHDISLAPAFQSSHLYYKGEIIVASGFIYSAKTTFTSATLVDLTNDWNLVGSNTLAVDYQRMYTLAFAGGATGDQTNHLFVSADFPDTLPFKVKDIAPQIDESTWLAQVANIYLKNSSVGVFVVGTDNLTTITTKSAGQFWIYGV